MKAREIRKVVAKPELVAGWLAVDKVGRKCVVFFPGNRRPRFVDDDSWDYAYGTTIQKYSEWTRGSWQKQYGSSRLPKPGACERVRLEL